MTATKPARSLRIVRQVETPSVTIIDLQIKHGRLVDGYRVKRVNDGFVRYEWSHASDMTRHYTVRCLSGSEPSTCTCPAQRFTPGTPCRHIAASKKLLEEGVI